MKTINTDTIVIGAGPAGLFAAIHSVQSGVIVLEKNEKPGKKLLISGTGRCNITHDCGLNEFFEHYGENHRFLKNALHAFTNIDLIHFFNTHGLATVVDKNGKVFPSSQKASDVLDVLLACCAKNRIPIHTGRAVSNVEKTQSGFEVTTENTIYRCANLLITSGGMSYPHTGSTGDGYRFAKQLGHSIIPPKPSLSPVFVADYEFAELAGVSLQQLLLSIYRDNKKMREHKGDIGFTHKGLSGPGILDISRFIQADDIIKLNFVACNSDNFRNSIIEAGIKEGKTAVQTWLKSYEIPRSLFMLLLKRASVNPEIKMGEITKLQRNTLVSEFCECSFKVSRVGGFNMAMATSGGVNLLEVNAKTMESKLVPCLFFAGEVLDIDGDTGGYNLQAAFSTAVLAANNLR